MTSFESGAAFASAGSAIAASGSMIFSSGFSAAESVCSYATTAGALEELHHLLLKSVKSDSPDILSSDGESTLPT